MPRRSDLESICLIGSGPDRDRPGVRVRLRRLAGAEGAARGRLPHDRRQLEPGDDHDRPRLRRPHVPRAARRRGRRRASSSASGPTRCCRRWAARRRSTSRSQLAETGVLDELGVELIGAGVDAINRAEDRELFRTAVQSRRAAGARRRRSCTRSTSSRAWRCPRSCGRRSRSAATAAGSPTRARSSHRRSRRACASRRSARCSSRSRCAAGTSSSSRSCATSSTTS